MFLVRAFIKNNTIELRNKLEKIGYKNHGKSSNYGNLNCLYCACGSYFECNQLPARGTVVIDCGYNQDLFLAIAALNNETDKYQWFWSTGWHRISGEPLPDKWILCDQNTLEHFGFVNNSPNSYSRDIWKKASVDDLIKHFK